MDYIWEQEPVFCFTSDIDWASEAVVRYSHDLLQADTLKLTYFNTNPSTFLDELQESARARILIHPNFLPDSSHGGTYEEVMDYCRRLVPDADGFRTHRYFEVNDVMDEYAARGFRFFSNHCTRCEVNLKPLLHRSGMLSIPIFLEDGGYLLMDPSLDFEGIPARLLAPGLKVINFHPAHMALNTPHFAYTRQIKDSMSRERWNNLDGDDIRALQFEGNGIRTIVQRIIAAAFSARHTVLTMHEIVQIWESARSTTAPRCTAETISGD